MLQKTILGRLQPCVELDRLKQAVKQGIDAADPAILKD